MADLSSLIRLHKHELDEKQKVLGQLYDRLKALEDRKQSIQERREREMASAGSNFDMVTYTLAGFLEKSIAQEAQIDEQIFVAHQEVEVAVDDMLESFGELKKYELTQEERLRIEKEERKLKEGRMFDDIAIENYVRRQEEGE
jgi:flagellar export protein FliJ